MTSGSSCAKKKDTQESRSQFYRKTPGKFLMVNVSKAGQVFHCEICGNVVVVKESGGGELICCGEPMELEE
jgi:desulfoferrodoxin-like iron-binding protein